MTAEQIRPRLDSGAFLNRDRVNGYAKIAVAATIAFVAVAHAQNWRAGTDFLAFWIAARQALAAAPTAAYDVAETLKTQRDLGFPNLLPFLSPPPFLLAIAPAGLIAYRVALAVWLAGTFSAFALSLRWLPSRLYWPALAFPAALVCGLAGQTGLLTAALTAGALGALPRRKVLAGVLIGCLIIKPHLAILFPFALMAGREWRAFVGATVTVLFALAASAVVFGPEIFEAYRAQSAAMSATLIGEGAYLAGKLQSALGVGLAVGLPYAAAVALQALSTLAAISATVSVWRRDRDPFRRSAVLCAAAPLATPYLLGYDLPLLALPLAYLAHRGMQDGFPPCGRGLLLLAGLSPLVAHQMSQPLMPIVAAALLLACIRAGTTDGRASLS